MTADPIARARALPCWSDPTDAHMLGGGITNHNVCVTDRGQHYVVRLGADIPEHMIQRWNELSISRTAHEIGLSPEVIHDETGVLVLRFVDAAPLSGKDLHDEATLKNAVSMLKTLHQQGTRSHRGAVLSFWVFHILRSYGGFLHQNGSAHTPKLTDLLDQATVLETMVGPVELVLSHNDLLPANILCGPDRLWLIDWEYGGLNSPLFDLGGLASNAALESGAEEAMLSFYFGAPPDRALWRRYNAMKCASLLRETMWSMVSELTSELEFNYEEYTEQNLSGYRAAFAELTDGYP